MENAKPRVQLRLAWGRIHFVPLCVQVLPSGARVSRDPAIGNPAPADGIQIPIQVSADPTTAMAARVKPSMAEDGVKAMVCHTRQDHDPGCIPSFRRARARWDWWLKNATSEVTQLIREGVEPHWPCPMLPVCPTVRSMEDQQGALQILESYKQAGAVTEVHPSEARFLVPWFVLRKVDGAGRQKMRLISDCRRLNSFLQTKPFRLDSWNQIFPFLRKGHWAVKIDLKDAYFHMELSARLKPYVTLQVGERYFQFQAACFGLSTLPRLWQTLMKTFLRLWRRQGLLVFIYLDDIIIFGKNPDALGRHLGLALRDLNEAGMQINAEKSVLQPVQELQHLGFTINLKEGYLSVPTEKLKSVRKELGKLVTHSSLSTRKMAAILGTVRSFLAAMPFLRAFTDNMLAFVNQHKCHGWDTKLVLPPALQCEVRRLGELMVGWKGQKFLGQVPI
jgi:hypothetical protein